MATQAPVRPPLDIPSPEAPWQPQPCLDVCPTCGGGILVRTWQGLTGQFVEHAAQSPLTGRPHGCGERIIPHKGERQ